MTDSLETKHYEVISGIYAATKNGKIDWEETGRSGVFSAEMGKYSCTITTEPDREYPEAPDYFIVLLDEIGNPVESISNRTISETPPSRPKDALHPYTMLGEIYELARRQVLGVDVILDSVLEFLKNK